MEMRIDGETRIFPIVGDPIAQVKSPALLSRIMANRGFNGLVVPIHVSADGLADFMTCARRLHNVEGIIVTVPHKPAALEFCDRLSDSARFAGSVNVMRRRDDGSWAGDNTDGRGYMDGVRACGFDIAGKRALLVGVGGAGSAIAYEILNREANWLSIHDANIERRDAVIARLSEAFPGKVGAGNADPTGFDFIGNATPVGMREGDPLPVEAGKLVSGQFVADAITKPEVTPLLQEARERGCNTMPGLGMFNAQAEILVDILLAADVAK
ncbi:shikimate dehydrogenase family protein [Roseibium aggregatum]|uniref:Shikimate dehydrogenase n=1 Tax=Roseibium aggregatum TaxID=187304 RepID=A0A926P6G9_9HYPH|nr:shikimate dehydrogenase [Roseibium aggregatum]MBD1549401.1 shikimate dehydrogenase [Roseibium aggregatum]